MEETYDLEEAVPNMALAGSYLKKLESIERFTSDIQLALDVGGGNASHWKKILKYNFKSLPWKHQLQFYKLHKTESRN